MPFHIDRFKASPSVQAMHPAARAGYLYLLSCAWQSDDCTLPGDNFNLAEMSGLGDELWETFGPRIRRKFNEGPGGRLMNPVLSDEWNEAKRIFEARQASAKRTNEVRPSPHADIAPLKDRQMARRVISAMVRKGIIPSANEVPCVDCGHINTDNEKCHEYDHYLGYEPEHYASVQPVCINCHVRREESRRKRWMKTDTVGEQSPSRSPSRGPSRSADTITGTVTITNTKEQKATPKAAPSSFVAPLWIHHETWKAFEEMRRKIRAPLTDRARQNIVAELQRLQLSGHDPDAVLNQSITRSWRGVFEIGGNGNGTHRKLSKYEQMRRDDEELFGRAEEDSPGVN